MYLARSYRSTRRSGANRAEGEERLLAFEIGVERTLEVGRGNAVPRGRGVDRGSPIKPVFFGKGAPRGARGEEHFTPELCRVDRGLRGELAHVFDELLKAVREAFVARRDRDGRPRVVEVVATSTDVGVRHVQVRDGEFERACAFALVERAYDELAVLAARADVLSGKHRALAFDRW